MSLQLFPGFEMLAGKLSKYAKYLFRSKCRYPLSSVKRYKILLDLVHQSKCRTIMEIGVYNGKRGIEMIDTASIHRSPGEITYLGFDLFEEMDENTLKDEFSKMPSKLEDVRYVLAKTGANINLFKGWSKATLQKFASKRQDYPEVDLIFIDGGHSVEAIASDWMNASKIMTARTIVVFDDYYVDCPEVTRQFGCNKIIDKIDRNIFSVDVSDIEDCFQKEWGILKVSMVKVSCKSDL